jgi:hypothetical protein
MAQKLYRITTEFWGKDLNEKAILGYVVAETEEQIAQHISKKYVFGQWFGEGYDDASEVETRRQDYIDNKGDSHTEYAGEFYDQKFGWEEVMEITSKQIAFLKTIGVVDELTA